MSFLVGLFFFRGRTVRFLGLLTEKTSNPKLSEGSLGCLGVQTFTCRREWVAATEAWYRWWVRKTRVWCHFWFNKLPPSKLTWHWKITICNRRYIFKWLFVHCHVSFRGCTHDDFCKFCQNVCPFRILLEELAVFCASELATDTQATATGGDSCPRTATFTGGDSFTTHRQFSISIIEQSPCAMDTWLLMVFDLVRLCSIVFVFGHLLIVARISHKAFLWHITVTQIACKYISPTLFCKPTDCNEKTSSQKTWTSKGAQKFSSRCKGWWTHCVFLRIFMQLGINLKDLECKKRAPLSCEFLAAAQFLETQPRRHVRKFRLPRWWALRRHKPGDKTSLLFWSSLPV